MACANHANGRRALLVCLALAPIAVMAQAAELPRIDDLRSIAAQMPRERAPLLLFFSVAGCPHCIEVRRNYLAPRLKQQPGLLIREVEITSGRSFIGLAGAKQTEADLASRFGVRMTPVVQLVDAGLQPIGRPLVGIDAAGFYESYLVTAIDEAQRLLRRR